MKKKKLFLVVGTFLSVLFVFMSFRSYDSKINAGAKGYDYLALGDSYTICESVEEKDQWPKVLAKMLTARGVLIKEPTIIAKTGWRTDNMLAAAKSKIGEEKYDLVSLLIGVNNEFQGEDVSGFVSKFKSCLEYAIAHCERGSKAVFVFSIPDYGFTPYGKKNQKKISKRIDDYNEVCQSVSKKLGVTFFNITDISRRGLNETDLVARDGLHPSAKQYQLWLDTYIGDIKSLILFESNKTEFK